MSEVERLRLALVKAADRLSAIADTPPYIEHPKIRTVVERWAAEARTLAEE